MTWRFRLYRNPLTKRRVRDSSSRSGTCRLSLVKSVTYALSVDAWRSAKRFKRQRSWSWTGP